MSLVAPCKGAWIEITKYMPPYIEYTGRSL